MSRERACRLAPNTTCALISISTPKVVYQSRPVSAGWGVPPLALAFSDVSHGTPDYDDGYTRFDSVMATAAVRLARQAEAAGCEDLVVHCDKGLSRSVGIALALHEAGFGDLTLWECHRPTQANELVLQHLRAVAKRPNVGTKLPAEAAGRSRSA